MTIHGFLDWMDAIHPSAYSHVRKAAWVNDLEAVIWNEILLQPLGLWRPCRPLEEEQRSLLLPDCWQRVYVAYLTAMIDFANGEFTSYANAMNQYNARIAELGAWYAETFEPAKNRAVWASLGRAAYNGEDMTVTLPAALPDGAAVLAAECRISTPFEAEEAFSLTREPEGDTLLRSTDVRADRAGTYRRCRLVLPADGGQRGVLTFGEELAPGGEAEFRVLLQPKASPV